MAPTFMAGNKAGRLFIGGQDVKKAYTAGELIFSKGDGPTPPPGPPLPPGPATYELLIGESSVDLLTYTGGLEIPLIANTDEAYIGNDGRDYIRAGGTGYTGFQFRIDPWLPGEVQAIYHQIVATKINSAGYPDDRVQARITAPNIDSNLLKPDHGFGGSSLGPDPVYASSSQGTGPDFPDILKWSSGTAGGDAETLTTVSVSGEGQSIWLGNTKMAEDAGTWYSMWGSYLDVLVYLAGDSASGPTAWPRLYSHKIWVIPAP